MSSRSLDVLNPTFRERVDDALSRFASADIDVLVYCTLRSLRGQAILYRKGRPWATIAGKIADFRRRGLDPLADILLGVGPQYGRWLTNAAPGESWHNYGEAVDAVPLIAGKPVWDPFVPHSCKFTPEWEAFGRIWGKAGLWWSGRWRREYVHVQLRPIGNPFGHFGDQGALQALELQHPEELGETVNGSS